MSKRFLSLGAALLAAACTSTPPQQHEYSLMLDALPLAGVENVQKTETLHIRRVDLPAFLQTRALAMQVGENEIVSARHHSWTDRLDDSIAGVLELALVEARPQLAITETTDAACKLELSFDRFHAADKGEVLASGRYSLVVNDVRTDRRFDVSRVLPVGGYANAVSQLRLSLDDLGDEIGKVIEVAGGCTFE